MKKYTTFNYPVSLVPLKIANNTQDTFRKQLLNVPYLLYEVEQLSDGKKIVINKPGGKRNFGRLSQNDFMVFIFEPSTNELWLISHQILSDLEDKSKVSTEETIKIIDGLKMVCDGKEPDLALKEFPISTSTGLSPELLYKVYKWIWGQEDCNYPTKQGRWLSMDAILEFQNKLKKCELQK